MWAALFTISVAAFITLSAAALMTGAEPADQ
jgi:hypothetical protein